jgi:branched-chain amino acid transport system substrate-binding protein
MISRFCYLILALSAVLVPLNVVASPRPFKIGVVIPLTGVTAEYGEAIRNGIELAREDYPELQKSVSLQYEDQQFDVKLAVSAFSKLRTVDQVDLIIVFGLGPCKALGPLAEQYRVPLVAICIDTAVAKGRPYVMRLQSSAEDYMRATARWVCEREMKRIGFVVADLPYTQAIFEAIEKPSREYGVETVLLNRVPSDQMDFRSDLSRARLEDLDGVGVFVSAGQIAAFARQARELKFQKPLIGSNFFGSVSEVKAARGALNGAVFAEVELRRAFVERFVQKFESSAQLGFASVAYEFFRSTDLVLRREAKPLSGLELFDRLNELQTLPGVATSGVEFLNTPDEGRHARFELVMQQVDGNGYKLAPR